MDLSTNVWLMQFLPKGRFGRNVGILTGGTVVAQGIAILVTPILTRLYTPADFNPLALYISLISLLTVAASFRYNTAIPLGESDKEAINLLVLSVVLSLVVSLLIAVPIILIPDWIGKFIGYPRISTYLWLVPIGVVLAAWYDALQFWATRKHRMPLIARTRLTRALFGSGAQLSLGAIRHSPFGLIFGHMVYCGMGVVGLASSVLQDDREHLSSVSMAYAFKMAVKYIRYPIFAVPDALLNVAGIEAPVLIIAAFSVGPEAAYLMLAMRIVGLPMSLIGSSVAQVFLAEAPDRQREGTLGIFTRRTMWKLFKRGGPIIALIGLVAPYVFPLAFGAAWSRAGLIVAWTAPWYILQFVASPVSVLLYVLNRMRTAMFLQFFGCIMRVGLVGLAALTSPNYMTEIYAVSGAVFYLIYVIVLLYSIPKPY